MPTKENDDLLNPDDFEDDDELSPEDEDDDSNAEDETDSSKTDDDSDDDGKSNEDEKAKQEKEKNAHFAELRRKKEADERAKREKEIMEKAKLEGKIEALKRNPYTNEEIKDEDDLKEYELMKEIDDNGDDPLADYSKYKKAQEKKAKENATKDANELEEKRKRIAGEVEELHQAYPNLDLKELSKDDEYAKACDKDGHRMTMLEIYENLINKRRLEELEEAERKRAERREKRAKDMANKNNTPSSSSGGNLPNSKVADMTDEEFKQYWDAKYRH